MSTFQHFFHGIPSPQLPSKGTYQSSRQEPLGTTLTFPHIPIHITPSTSTCVMLETVTGRVQLTIVVPTRISDGSQLRFLRDRTFDRETAVNLLIRGTPSLQLPFAWGYVDSTALFPSLLSHLEWRAEHPNSRSTQRDHVFGAGYQPTPED